MIYSNYNLLMSILFLPFLLLVGCQQYLEQDPPIPRGVEAHADNEQVTLFWQHDTSSILAGYNVYRSTESFTNVAGLTPVNRGTLITDTTYTDTTVDNGTTYYYRVTSEDSLETESQLSLEVEVTPFPSPPDRP